MTDHITRSDARDVSVVVLGASGAVGTEAVRALLAIDAVRHVTLLNRRTIDISPLSRTTQHIVDPLDAGSYRHLLAGHGAAICTLGVGRPSQVSRDELVRIDKTAALDFARACRAVDIGHFELLSAVGAHPTSSNHYLRTKGELRDALIATGFRRLSIFEPSMILTPTNRYDWKQGLILALWPKLAPLLAGSLKIYRGVRVETLGAAMAHNIVRAGDGVEILRWPQFQALAADSATPRAPAKPAHT